MLSTLGQVYWTKNSASKVDFASIVGCSRGKAGYNGRPLYLAQNPFARGALFQKVTHEANGFESGIIFVQYTQLCLESGARGQIDCPKAQPIYPVQGRYRWADDR